MVMCVVCVCVVMCVCVHVGRCRLCVCFVLVSYRYMYTYGMYYAHNRHLLGSRSLPSSSVLLLLHAAQDHTCVNQLFDLGGGTQIETTYRVVINLYDNL